MQQKGFATSEVQISASETPLYRLETIYRRALENLRFCLLNNERTAWEPMQREWQNSAVWMKHKP